MNGLNGRAVRCGGAEKHGRRWRVVEIAADGSRAHRYFEGPDAERDARLYVEVFRAETKDRSIGGAVNEYLDHLARFGGAKRRPLKPRSVIGSGAARRWPRPAMRRAGSTSRRIA